MAWACDVVDGCDSEEAGVLDRRSFDAFRWELGRLERLVDGLPFRPDVLFLGVGDADAIDDERGIGGVEVLVCRILVSRPFERDAFVDGLGLCVVARPDRRWPELLAFGRGVLLVWCGFGGVTLLGRGRSTIRGGDVRAAGSGVEEAATIVRREMVAMLKEADGAAFVWIWGTAASPTP